MKKQKHLTELKSSKGGKVTKMLLSTWTAEISHMVTIIST